MLASIDGVDYLFSSRLPKNAEKSAQYLLIRLLLGAARLERAGHQVEQHTDYSRWPRTIQTRTGAKAVEDYLHSYGVGRTQASFVRETTADNRRLFQDLLAEFSNFFVETERGSHTAAFVFLYRGLERLSFSVPLLYCATSTDFVGTFNDLKALFNKDASGELGLLKKFINQGRLIDPLILDTADTIDFSVSTLNGGRYYSAVTTRFSAFHSMDPTRLQLEVTYRTIPDFLVMLRNRYFHFRTGDGQKNISNRDVHDPDEFFSILNQVFCNFLGVLTLHAIAQKYKS